MPHDADVVAYAHGLYRRYREGAAPYARTYAEKLRICGDLEGHRVWLRVAQAIEDGEALTLAA